MDDYEGPAGGEMTGEKLRSIASWLDTYDAIVEQVIITVEGGIDLDGKKLTAVRGKDVQDDLRRWADELDALTGATETTDES